MIMTYTTTGIAFYDWTGSLAGPPKNFSLCLCPFSPSPSRYSLCHCSLQFRYETCRPSPVHKRVIQYESDWRGAALHPQAREKSLQQSHCLPFHYRAGLIEGVCSGNY